MRQLLAILLLLTFPCYAFAGTNLDYTITAGSMGATAVWNSGVARTGSNADTYTLVINDDVYLPAGTDLGTTGNGHQNIVKGHVATATAWKFTATATACTGTPCTTATITGTNTMAVGQHVFVQGMTGGAACLNTTLLGKWLNITIASGTVITVDVTGLGCSTFVGTVPGTTNVYRYGRLCNNSTCDTPVTSGTSHIYFASTGTTPNGSGTQYNPGSDATVFGFMGGLSVQDFNCDPTDLNCVIIDSGDATHVWASQDGGVYEGGTAIGTGGMTGGAASSNETHYMKMVGVKMTRVGLNSGGFEGLHEDCNGSANVPSTLSDNAIYQNNTIASMYQQYIRLSSQSGCLTDSGNTFTGALSANTITMPSATAIPTNITITNNTESAPTVNGLFANFGAHPQGLTMTGNAVFGTSSIYRNCLATGTQGSSTGGNVVQYNLCDQDPAQANAAANINFKIRPNTAAETTPTKLWNNVVECAAEATSDGAIDHEFNWMHNCPLTAAPNQGQLFMQPSVAGSLATYISNVVVNPLCTGGNTAFVDLKYSNNQGGSAGTASAAGEDHNTYWTACTPASVTAHEFQTGEIAGLTCTSSGCSTNTWVANHAYVTTDYLSPTYSLNNQVNVYKITTAGTSNASTQPTWCQTTSCTVADGTAVWTNQGVQTGGSTGGTGNRVRANIFTSDASYTTLAAVTDWETDTWDSSYFNGTGAGVHHNATYNMGGAGVSYSYPTSGNGSGFSINFCGNAAISPTCSGGTAHPSYSAYGDLDGYKPTFFDTTRTPQLYDALCGGAGTTADLITQYAKRNGSATYNHCFDVQNMNAWLLQGWAPMNLVYAGSGANGASYSGDTVGSWVGAVQPMAPHAIISPVVF